jgi:hypothetical protein
LTGTLIGTVRDEQGLVLAGARVSISSPALIGGPATQMTNGRGQLRFPVLPPGLYALEIEMPGFAILHDRDILIAAGSTMERTATLKRAGVEESIVVEGTGSRIEARNPGFGARFGSEDIDAIPTRRASMYDFVRAAPGVSPTSPSGGSGNATTVSVFGSGTNENQFLIDGMNTTCPCSGVARTEPGIDFIHEVQVSAVGTSAEFGNMQGAMINVVTKQGSERFSYDGSYYGQASALTSQPVRLPYLGSGQQQSGYERAKYEDFTNSLGGPAIRDRLGSSPDISGCETTTASQAPIPRVRARTRCRNSSRSSPGASLRVGNWCRAFTTRLVSTPSGRPSSPHSRRQRARTSRRRR